jgi:hypothetical protein
MAGEAAPEETVSLFAIPEGKAESTLKAVMAMNEAGGGDLFMLGVGGETAATLSGTACVWEGNPPNSFKCSDTDT